MSFRRRLRDERGQFTRWGPGPGEHKWPAYEFRVKRSYLSVKQLKNGGRVFPKEVVELMRSRRLLKRGDGVEEVRDIIIGLKRTGDLPAA